VLTSRDNSRVRHWKKLAEDSRYRRTEKRALIEGAHLLAAALQSGARPATILATEEGLARAEIAELVARSGLRPVLLGRGVFGEIVDADTPAGVAAEIPIPAAARVGGSTVFLEGVQDPGNVGAILRSAAAFGVRRIVLDRACADPWSPKALRAGMGGHFVLAVQETRDLPAEIEAFEGTVACAVTRGGVALRKATLTGAVAWIFGAEGRGLSEDAMRCCDLQVTIPIAEGSESLNVAAAAAICLYEASRFP
jgi:RNA methyltransferase, TrmH family